MNIVHRWLLLPVLCSVCCLIFLMLYAYRSREHVIKILDRHHRLFKYTSPLRRWYKMIAYICAIVAFACALLRPQWGMREQGGVAQQRDIFIALDVSKSMLAQDVKPSRIALAQKKLLDLLFLLQGDRVGLIFFASGAYMQAPLTADQDLVRGFLGQAQHSIGNGSTRLEEVLRQLLVQIDDGSYRSNIAIIVTDGEDFSRDLASIKKELAQKHVSLITYGIGTLEGGTIPTEKNTPLVDDEGKQVVTRLNELMLRSLAEQTGGIFVRSTPNEADIATIYAYVQQQEHKREQQTQQVYLTERYPWFAALAGLFLVIEMIL